MLPEAESEAEVHKTVHEHLETVTDVLDALCQAGLAVSSKKYKIAVSQATVLGFKYLLEGCRPLDDRAEAIACLLKPRSVHEVCSFIAACNYYCVWVQDFAIKAVPLYELTCKGAKFFWAFEKEKAFNVLKHAILTAPVLCSPVYGNPD
ncbi:hypothetical protein BX667DRAFT_525489 [Coemansia mojavensis]|nr:hypothetical protein BX667DRAFT_525489 [Coemansia mojavensis]